MLFLEKLVSLAKEKANLDFRFLELQLFYNYAGYQI